METCLSPWAMTESYPVQNLSSGDVPGAFLQTPATVLDIFSGPIGHGFTIFIQHWAGVWPPHGKSILLLGASTG